MRPGLYEAEVVEVKPDTDAGHGIRAGYCDVAFDGGKYRMVNGKSNSIPPRFRKVGSKVMVQVTENYGLKYAG